MRRWLRPWRWILCALLSGGATLAAEVMSARLLRSMLGSTSIAQTAAVSGVLILATLVLMVVMERVAGISRHLR